jgi:hypothetical protein
MLLDYSKEIKEDAFFHAWSKYINALRELREYEVNYSKGLYTDLSKDHTDRVLYYYKNQVNIYLYLKELVEQDLK